MKALNEQSHQPSLFPPQRDVYTVSRLNREARNLLEGGFPLLWIEGEISNLASPSSGHLYFSLKDNKAQVRCAMFRQRNRLLAFQVENGQHVVVRARVSLYEARGEYQCIVEDMEDAGEGALRRQFEALKQRLAEQGLFAPEHKKLPPRLPARIGVVTSPTGAAIRDILMVLRRRFPAIPVLIYPVPVQGEGAARRITRMLKTADRRRDCDVLILARGGGSLEDLWAFNDEGLARAIHECETPIVVGVGHEIDFTIADFVADVRAPTPSAAAEVVVPDHQDWLRQLQAGARRLQSTWKRRSSACQEALRMLEKRLRAQHPGQRLVQGRQRLDELEQRLSGAFGNGIRHRRFRLKELSAHLLRLSPAHRILQAKNRTDALTVRLEGAVGRSIENRSRRLAVAARALDTISPLATLERGYAIATHCPRAGETRILRDPGSVKPGDAVELRVAKGRLLTRVLKRLKK